jgi:transglutaminase-like putative cysteine protease
MSDDAAAPQPPEQEWTEPLLLKVRHLTRYDYHGQVWDSFNEARLQPVSDHTQLCCKFFLRIEPIAEVQDYPDFFGNAVHYFTVKPPHGRLEIEAESLLQTCPDTRGPAPATNPPEALKDTSIMEHYFDFLHDSHFVSLEQEVWRESVDALPHGVSDLWQDTLAIGDHIKRTFTYAPRLTTVNTKPAEVVRTRQGVCQDFAHVMLGICRIHGMPARYVSGYFYNPHRAPDEIEASHAWIEVYLPGYGWKGFDPTHNRATDTRYVKVASGRDYDDIRPVSGTFRGAGTREFAVEVQVTNERADSPTVAIAS